MIREFFINLLIKTVVRWPKLLESEWLKNLILGVHGRIAEKFEEISQEQVDYKQPLRVGLDYIKTEVNQPRQVLDLATGTGFAALEAAAVLQPKEVVGIDLAPEMLELAREKVRKGDQTDISFSRQDAANLNFRSNSFELVMVSNAPFYLQEITRVLKPGGLFLLSLSLGGKVIANKQKRVKQYLSRGGLQLQKLQVVERGIFVVARF